MKYKSSYKHYRLVTVKIKLGVINSFRPGYVSSLACSLFPLFSLFSGEGKLHFYFCCNRTTRQVEVEAFGALLRTLWASVTHPQAAGDVGC